MKTAYEIKCTEKDIDDLFIKAVNDLKKRMVSKRLVKVSDYKKFKITIETVGDSVSIRSII
jgi:uncharacterized protein Yka (UPF0111/DUF47 family)